MMEIFMKLLRYLGLFGLSLFVACGQPPEPSKPLPVVSLKASNAEVFVGGLITLTASVTASSGVTEVEFFEGITSLGTDSSVPFEVVVSNFTLAGLPRAFKAVATDNNGLKGEGLTSVNVLASKPTNFQLIAGDFLAAQASINFVFSPDQLELKADYETGTLSNQTKWTLKTPSGEPAPTDGSLGTIVAIPGDPDGLFSSKVRYVPPEIAQFDTSLKATIEAQSVQDPTKIIGIVISFRKKGTLDGIEIRAESQLKLRIPASIQVETIGAVGNVNNTAIWSLAVPGFGTLTCPPNSLNECRVNVQGDIVGTRVLFTPTKLGEVGLIAVSQHNSKRDSIGLTIVP
jgi:hypothetical protein